MSEYKKLEEEFKQKVKMLQDNCDHKELTEWIPVYWAFGHSSGYPVLHCKRCNKVIATTKKEDWMVEHF